MLHSIHSIPKGFLSESIHFHSAHEEVRIHFLLRPSKTRTRQQIIPYYLHLLLQRRGTWWAAAGVVAWARAGTWLFAGALWRAGAWVWAFWWEGVRRGVEVPWGVAVALCWAPWPPQRAAGVRAPDIPIPGCCGGTQSEDISVFKLCRSTVCTYNALPFMGIPKPQFYDSHFTSL